MNREERDRLAEQFLDKALARYGDVEPRPGLEGRILARVQESHAVANTGRQGWASRWFGWRGAVVAATAVVAIAIGIHWLRPAQNPVPNTTASSASRVVEVPLPAAPKTAATPAKASPRAPRRARNTQRKTAVERDEPRLAKFPAAAPLSEQERLLISYLQRTPRDEIMTVVKENEQFQQEFERRLRETKEMRTPTE